MESVSNTHLTNRLAATYELRGPPQCNSSSCCYSSRVEMGNEAEFSVLFHTSQIIILTAASCPPLVFSQLGAVA